ncbi:MAG: sigma-70 family RNA polymerase sigma factor [Gracilibacteraceae bacterium]|nr:sigma-70 family RNA polymerase sigma factor [Gracilibacteraceae bacterium]
MDDEQRLIRRVQRSGDRAAADALVRIYYDEIFGYVRKQTPSENDALDVTQDTFIGVLRTIGRYDPKAASFRTWLYKVASNKLVDYYRSRARVSLSEPLLLDEAEPIDETDFTRRIQDGDFADRVCAFVGTLPPDTQRIFRLHIWGGQTFAGIASALEMPEGSVKSRYYRLINTLRKEFADYGR